MATIFTDERLAADLANENSPGPQRVARILIEIPVDVRDAIVAEANTMSNISPGWTYSGAVGQIAHEYRLSGSVPTRYRDISDDVIRREKLARGW